MTQPLLCFHMRNVFIPIYRIIPMPQKLWFKAKLYGWGWYPCSWEGWGKPPGRAAACRPSPPDRDLLRSGTGTPTDPMVRQERKE